MRRSVFFRRANRIGGPQWFGGRQYAVLVNGGPDLALGHYWHDGFGEWQISVHVPYWRALVLILKHEGWFAGWARFPRCCVAISQAYNDEDARMKVEIFSGVTMRTPDEI